MFTKAEWDKSFIFNSIRLRRESLSTDTAAGYGARGTAAGGLSPRPHAVTRDVPFGPGGGAGSGSRAEKEPLQAVAQRLSVRSLYSCSDHQVRLRGTL